MGIPKITALHPSNAVIDFLKLTAVYFNASFKRLPKKVFCKNRIIRVRVFAIRAGVFLRRKTKGAIIKPVKIVF